MKSQLPNAYETPYSEQLATQKQKNYIHVLITRAEFDPRTITYQYRRIAVEERWIGKPVQEWLDQIKKMDVSDIIERLKDCANEEK